MKGYDDSVEEQIAWLVETIELAKGPCVICSHQSFDRERGNDSERRSDARRGLTVPFDELVFVNFAVKKG